MQTKARIRLAVLLLAALMLAYPCWLVYRYIELSGGSFSQAGARTALNEAIKLDDLTIVRALLLVGVDPNRRLGDQGFPPLSIAAQTGNDRAVEMLLNHGAHPDSAERVFVDSFEIANLPPGAILTFDRPMFRAAKAGHQKVVAVLRAHGARYEIWDAVFLGDEDTVQRMAESAEGAVLLQAGGQDALAIAVNSSSIDAARQFLDLGVDPFEQQHGLPSPYDFAVDGEHAEMVALFEAHRAKTDSSE